MSQQTIGSILGISRNEYRDVVAPIIAYLFGLITQLQLFSHMGSTYERHEIRGFIDAVQESGYVLKNCKLFAYAKYHDPSTKAADYEVHPTDARFLSSLNLEQVGMPIPIIDLATYNAMETELFTDPHMSAYLGKFINAKMRFLVAWGMTFDDLYNQLVQYGLFALLHKFPRYKSKAHFVNIAKNAAKTKGKTMITTNTRQKRQELYEGPDGYIISRFENIESRVDLADEANPIEHMDNVSSLVKISKRFGPQVLRYMNCMSGQYDQGFSEYLAADNREEIERIPYDRYRQKLERYMGLTHEQTEALMKRIREHM